MKKINKEEFEGLVLKAEGKTVVDFYADWCGPCKMLGPILEEVAAKWDDISFYAVDIDVERELTANYEVMSVPTVMLFSNGELVNKFIGVQSKEAVEEFLNS